MNFCQDLVYFPSTSARLDEDGSVRQIFYVLVLVWFFFFLYFRKSGRE